MSSQEAVLILRMVFEALSTPEPDVKALKALLDRILSTLDE
jgi:hypothetical protein